MGTSGDIKASIEMGLAQIMLELHSSSDTVEEIRGLLLDVVKRLERLERSLDHQKTA